MANFLHLFRDSGGAVYSWATDVARVCWKRDQTSLKISNIRSTSTTDVSNNASNEIELWDGLLEITGYSAQLTVQRRPNIPNISSFSYGLRHEDGLLTLSGLVPDIISRIFGLLRSDSRSFSGSNLSSSYPGSLISNFSSALRHAEVTLIPRSPTLYILSLRFCSSYVEILAVPTTSLMYSFWLEKGWSCPCENRLRETFAYSVVRDVRENCVGWCSSASLTFVVVEQKPAAPPCRLNFARPFFSCSFLSRHARRTKRKRDYSKSIVGKKERLDGLKCFGWNH